MPVVILLAVIVAGWTAVTFFIPRIYGRRERQEEERQRAERAVEAAAAKPQPTKEPEQKEADKKEREGKEKTEEAARSRRSSRGRRAVNLLIGAAIIGGAVYFLHHPSGGKKERVQPYLELRSTLPAGTPDTSFVVTVEGKTPFFTKTPIRVLPGDVFTLSGDGVIERGYGSEAQRFVGPWGGTILVRKAKSTHRALFSPEAWDVPIFGMTVMVGDENGPRRESTLAAYRDGGTTKTVNAFRVLHGERQVIYFGRAEPHRTDFRRENRLHYNDHAGRWTIHVRLFRQAGANG